MYYKSAISRHIRAGFKTVCPDDAKVLKLSHCARMDLSYDRQILQEVNGKNSSLKIIKL